MTRPRLTCLLLLALAGGAWAQEVDPELAALSIGIAPFEQVGPPEPSTRDLATLLAARILARGAGRTVAPASLVGAQRAEPSSERVRELAVQHGLTALVVGRVTRLGDRASIDVRLRSGVTGAVAGTYVAELPLGDPAEPVLDRLASQLVAGSLALSHVSLAPAKPAVTERRAAKAKARGSRSKKSDGLELDALGGDEPFSIRSDELEVSESETGRQMTFRGNVEARRGDLLLQTGELEAVYPEGEKQPSSLRALGSVRVRQGDREARCRRADYRRSEQRIYCRGDAVLRDGSDELRGDSIVFDLAERRVRVEGGTEVALSPRAADPKQDAESSLLGDLPTKGPVRIRAAHLEAIEEEGGGRRIRFEGSVEVAQEDLILRAREIDAIYPPKSQEPERLVARGDVFVVQKGREARCDEAVYLRTERRVDCIGNASLREGDDHVSGRLIAFDLAAEKVTVTGDSRLVLAPRPRKETATP